jgi:hypothetical protein
MGRKLSAVLLTQSLNQVMNASGKLRRWHERLCEYKKAGLVRTGLRRRVWAGPGQPCGEDSSLPPFSGETKKNANLKESA